MRTISSFLLDLLYPARCPICDGLLRYRKEMICAACIPKIRLVAEPLCMKCGKPLEDEREFCRDCSERRHVFDQGMAVFEYPSVAASLYRFKYGGRQEYARFYARCMAKKLDSCLRVWQPQALVPVPIHPSRKRKRGYNQAEILAMALSEETGIPVRKNLIKRVKKTRPQKALNSHERQNNLKKAFKICKNDVKLDTIIMIDDIYTTGSTMDAMAASLREHGVKHIYAASLAIGRGV